eukprot:COSAG01_NODE_2143_length_8317_cov_24.964103_2_plen_98_part_00
MPGAGGIGLSGAHDTPGPELATLLRPDGEARPAYLGLTGEQPYKQVRPPPPAAADARARCVRRGGSKSMPPSIHVSVYSCLRLVIIDRAGRGESIHY